MIAKTLLLILTLCCGFAAAQAVSGSGNTGDIAIWKNGTTIGDSTIYQSSSGSVGVGNQSPAAKLDISGSLISRGNLKINGSRHGLVFPNGTVQTTAAGKAFVNVKGASVPAPVPGGTTVLASVLLPGNALNVLGRTFDVIAWGSFHGGAYSGSFYSFFVTELCDTANCSGAVVVSVATAALQLVGDYDAQFAVQATLATKTAGALGAITSAMQALSYYQPTGQFASGINNVAQSNLIDLTKPLYLAVALRTPAQNSIVATPAITVSLLRLTTYN